MSARDVRELVVELEADGYELVRHRKHLVMRRPSDGATITLASTPSDRRALDNMRSARRRAEREARTRSMEVVAEQTLDVSREDRGRLVLPSNPTREVGRVVDRFDPEARRRGDAFFRIKRKSMDIRSNVGRLHFTAQPPDTMLLSLEGADFGTRPMTIPIVLNQEVVGKYILDSGSWFQKVDVSEFSASDDLGLDIMAIVANSVGKVAVERGGAPFVIDVARFMWTRDPDSDDAIASAMLWVELCTENEFAAAIPPELTAEQLMVALIEWSNQFGSWLSASPHLRTPFPRFTNWRDMDLDLDNYMVRLETPLF